MGTGGGGNGNEGRCEVMYTVASCVSCKGELGFGFTREKKGRV